MSYTKEELKVYNKQYYINNKDKLKKQQKEYFERNRDTIKEKSKIYRENNRTILKERSTEYTSNNPEAYILARCKHNAKIRNLEFDLSIEDIIIPSHCPYLGIKLEPSRSGRKDGTASIDRIDNSKGYIKGNVQIISDLANRMKNKASLEQLITFAKAVLEKHA